MRQISRTLNPLFTPNQISWQTLIGTLSFDQPSLAASYPYLLKLHTRCSSINGVSPILDCPPLPLTSAKKSVCVAEFLVNRLGFSREEAVAVASKVSTFKSKQRLDSVINFFEQIGFDDGQIRMVVSSVPKILGCGVENNLRPKITVIQEIGISGSDLVKFISNNPQIISASLNASILPTLELVRSVFHSDKDNMVKAIKSSFWMMNSGTLTHRNIELLRGYGVPEQKIQKFFITYPRIHRWRPQWLEEVMLKVEEELEIPRESGMFIYAVGEIATISKNNFDSKYEIFKSYGWTESDVSTMTRKCPSCWRSSDASIRTRLDYFMKEIGFDPSYLASFPVLLKYSLENRIFPRNAVLKLLKEKGVHESHLKFYSAMAATEAVFLRRFVLEYKDIVPDICDVYSGYKTAGRSLK